MKQTTTSVEKQILFEQSPDIGNRNVPNPLQQVIVENDSWEALPEVSEEIVELKPVKRTSWMVKVLATCLVGVLGIELVDFFVYRFENSPVLTSLYGIVTVVIGIYAGSALVRELKGLRYMNRSRNTQQSINKAIAENNSKSASQALEKVNRSLPVDMDLSQQKSWTLAKEKGLSAPELVETYSRVVLSQVDEKALSAVAKYSTEAVALVAISPVAIVDMLLLLWRNLRMIDKVSSLYGLQLGYWSRIRLLRQVFINMAYAGASELLVDIGTEAVGAELLGKLSGRFAQGFGAGMLTARLGISVMMLSRPVPFNDKKPSIGLVRKRIVKEIFSLISKSKGSPESSPKNKDMLE